MTSMKITGLCAGMALGLGLGAAGCNSFDAKPEDENKPRLIIPEDDRSALTAEVAPPPVSGGTLSVLSDGTVAIVADPEGDRVSLVDLKAMVVRSTIALQPGDEPGRSVEDAQKHVHVALRRGGAVLSLDPTTGAVLDRRSVCKAPRGIAFDAATGLLHVACAEGKLVSLPAQGGAVTRTLSLDADLRDVIVRGSELWLTRFKSAEILRVGSAGTLDKRITLPQAEGQLSQPSDSTDFSAPIAANTKNVTLQPGVAWRAIANSAAGAMLVHQETVTDEITITPPSASGSAYGGGSSNGLGCDGIVKNVVTTVAADGNVVSTQFMGPPLPVDIAISPNRSLVAIAHAGVPDPAAPRPFLRFPGDSSGSASGPVAFGGGGSSVTILSASDVSRNPCAHSQGSLINVPATAVAFTASGELLVQTRDPAQLLIQRTLPFGATETVDLGGGSRTDTGHDLFHRDAGGGIACASCHPEGGEDGRTWVFADSGERRTQALHVGLRDTAPFHWNGDLPNVGALMTQVFVGRMGGIRENGTRVSALSEWLFSIKAPAPIRDASDQAAQRGQALFQSAEVGCTTCHSGPKLTDNKSAAVDSVATTKLQVPSLIAVGYRAPFMHNGCAKTLAARFDPKCGGNQHGNVAGLSDDQRSDLVAYLESL